MPRSSKALRQREADDVHVKRLRRLEVRHLQMHVADPRFRRERPVAVNLDAVAVGVRKVERFADAVVRSALQMCRRLDESTERSRQVRDARRLPCSSTEKPRRS
jgi:hypothetical protein